VSTFKERYAIDVRDKIEKKGQFNYLSWSYAVQQLQLLDETATWTYPEPKQFGESWMVYCSVTAFGKTMTAQLPVMDHRKACIKFPNAWDINNAMQRVLAKAIALHGIGLYIYAGEDIPQTDEPQEELSPFVCGSLKSKQFHEVNDAVLSKFHQDMKELMIKDPKFSESAPIQKMMLKIAVELERRGIK